MSVPFFRPWRWPLSARVLLGVAIGGGLGLAFGGEPYPGLGGLRNEHLGKLAGLVIQVIKALATPLIAFAILDAFLRIGFTRRQGADLAVVCLVNVVVAMAIGLSIMNFFQPGQVWEGKLGELRARTLEEDATPAAKAKAEGNGLSLLSLLEGVAPKSMLGPLVNNDMLPLVVLCLMGGAALRQARLRQPELCEPGVAIVERLVLAGYHVTLTMIGWVVELVPLAMLGAAAQVVGQVGLEIVATLWVFLAVIVAGLAIHALAYYPASVWLWGRKSPLAYLRRGADPALTAFSLNSSLATAPVSLQALERLGVSEGSARLSTCVGTNFNNDGITLYEAMTALFVAQASGVQMTLADQIPLLFACVVVSFGASGIPNSGFLILPLVLSTVGLAPQTIAAALPLVMIVDAILARCRSSVNALGDMQVAIVLDRLRGPAGEGAPGKGRG